MSSSRGQLFVVSAPSGAGKSTLLTALMATHSTLRFSVSYTSRAPRAGDSEGVTYHFLSRERFDAMVAAEEFLEYADVFGHGYGTRAADTDALLDGGHDVLLDIDVQGMRQVRSRARQPVTTIFILPPSRDTLEARLRGRGTDADDAIARRLATATAEMAAVPEYDYVVLNDQVSGAVEQLASIVTAARASRAAMRQASVDVARTFGVALEPAAWDRARALHERGWR